MNRRHARHDQPDRERCAHRAGRLKPVKNANESPLGAERTGGKSPSLWAILA